ncbi:MAG TPA: T9SS type A sorting domain-containing protein [Paludibacteraceae bacterium]|nr:T9SS type A sorting domain-containing protein [Paludibacteraceae bacterium]HOU69418.1 T9SS type A sorting domain-containing protein [Paludibacteraceae bacterium]HPH63809.1 T9SS type A sorting domain-containing protein [Paludibacteraceae bacterium]HQF50187.1 T9SS type A sorting domain-containing protein [Paludibacteraceae bacterium]HQJ89957.1 T9SS type A sorting domain-containing protein [Paludibacteraceae bacterium]
MKTSVLKRLALAAMLVSSLSVSAQSVVKVKLYSEMNEKSYVVDDKGKLHFIDDNLYIEQTGSEQEAVVPLNDIQNITFKPYTPSSLETVGSNSFFVYPNPATDKVFISGLQNGYNVNVYSIDGVQLLKESYDSEKGIGIDNLSNGLYFVNAGGLTFKIEKK